MNIAPAPSLTVLLVSFNHAGYIQRALDGIAAQIYQGDIEVVVADDGSTDATVDIIDKWAQQNPRFHYRPLPRQGNLGVTRNYARAFAACREEDFVAVLEGDDYWIHPRKLAQQVEFLMEHLECNLCSTNYFVFDEVDENMVTRAPVSEGYALLDVRSLIADNLVGNFSTCVYRPKVLHSLEPGLFDLKAYDWIINICISRKAFIGFLRTPMSVYRLHGGGAWSAHSTKRKLEQQRDVIDDYDRITHGVYRAEFLLLRDRLERAIEDQGEDAKVLADGLPVIATPPRARAALPRTLLNLCPPIVLLLARLFVPPLVVQKMKSLWKLLK